MFRKGKRPELADKEDAEQKLIETYMPSAPTEEGGWMRRSQRQYGRIRNHFAETNGSGDEGRAGQVGRQAS